MGETSLDRLNKCMTPTDKEYTLDEQLDSISTDDYFDDMSEEVKQQLQGIEEVTLDDDENDIEMPTIDETAVPINPVIIDEAPPKEELFNNKQKRSRGRPSTTTSAQISEPMKPVKDTSKNPVFDQLSRDILDELRKKKFKLNRFNEESMTMLFDYMYSKF